MKKIISLFQRNYETDRLVRDEVVPGAEWVGAGEGVATEKIDGTCCMVKDGELYKRRDIKPGRKEPAGFLLADSDEVTGRKWGWVPVGDGPEDRWAREAWDKVSLPEGTYELVGPKVQGNPYDFETHKLLPHGNVEIKNIPRDYEGLKAFLAGGFFEGIVWHHPDGRMVKIKANDFKKKMWPKQEGS